MNRHFTIGIFACIVLFVTASRAQVVVDEFVEQAIRSASTTSLLSPVLEPLRHEVIVAFQGTGAPTASHLRILEGAGITNGIAFQSFPIVGVLATPLQINMLRTKSSVRSIFLNRDLQYLNEKSTDVTGVDRLRKDAEITAKNGGVPVTGRGVGVLINDSGVDGTHGDIRFNSHLVQNVLGTTNLASIIGILPPTYVENVPSTDTNSGHGTHCAGIVGGTGAMSGRKYEGVAPGADLVGYGSGVLISILDALGGLDYALQNKDEYGIRVVSNSWGSSGAFEPSDPINIATKTLHDNGIVSVFAAGNSGPSSGTMNPYSLAPWVISVAAGDINRRLADFSSRGVENDRKTFTIDGEAWITENRPTLTAPGVDIVSTRAISPLPVLSTSQDLMNLDPAHVPFYTHMSGTSMATPHVAGIVALMLEADETLTPAEIKKILQDTSTPMEGYKTWEAGSGYVNAFDAVAFVLQNKNAGAVTPDFPQASTQVHSFTGYPNPFSYRMTLDYTLPEATVVKLVIIDSHGNAVATLLNEYQEKGQHRFELQKDAVRLRAGLYVAKIKAGEYTKSIRLLVAD